SRFAPITHWLPMGFGVLAALGAIGAFSVVKRGAWACFPIWGFILIYCITVVAFIVGSRYRLPIVPFLIIIAGEGAVSVGRAALAGSVRRVIGGITVMSLVFAATKSIPAPKAQSTARGLTWLGIAENRAGRSDNAVALFREALTLQPSSCDARTDLGV